MTREINPKDTTRQAAYDFWMNAPNPTSSKIANWKEPSDNVS